MLAFRPVFTRAFFIAASSSGFRIFAGLADRAAFLSPAFASLSLSFGHYFAGLLLLPPYAIAFTLPLRSSPVTGSFHAFAAFAASCRCRSSLDYCCLIISPLFAFSLMPPFQLLFSSFFMSAFAD